MDRLVVHRWRPIVEKGTHDELLARKAALCQPLAPPVGRLHRRGRGSLSAATHGWLRHPSDIRSLYWFQKEQEAVMTELGKRLRASELEDSGDKAGNPTQNLTLGDIIASRFSRRDMLLGSPRRHGDLGDARHPRPGCQ